MKSAAFSSFQSAAAPEARVGGERDDPPPDPPAVASGKPDPVPGPPLFPVGFRCSVGYMGLARAGEPACRRDGEPCELNNGRVVALRLVADFRERDCYTCAGVGLIGSGGDAPACPECLGTCTEWVQEYPKGWEYGVWIGDREHGWYTEAELVAKGYAPPADPLAEPAFTDDLERLGFKFDGIGETMFRPLGVVGNAPQLVCGIETNSRADDFGRVKSLSLYWSTWPDKPKRSVSYQIDDNPTVGQVAALVAALDPPAPPPADPQAAASMWPPFPGPAFPPVSPPPAEPRTVYVILDPVTGRYWTGHGWATEPATFVRYLSAKNAEDTRALLERNTPRKNLHVVECEEHGDPNAPAVCDVCRQVVPQLAGYPRRDPATTAVVCQSCGKALAERARVAEWAEVVPLTPAEQARLDKLKGSDDPPHELGGES